MQSLSGHTSPVESVAFDSAEVLVLGGASTGVIKLWDLEEAKSKSISPLNHEVRIILQSRMVFIVGSSECKLEKWMLGDHILHD